ncbi:rhodanese-like domain-containing protein [Cecembia lonarensis]|uniref:Molybdopterin biosynthesis protein MoeB n=1 Tax=Cecembia lonarensis (strain CCUG 58316 / KCTC 22772 / LW9) TaxID=1225176 RepID=K1KX37_CECL9|nr:rhodanese-like domain-containing protein [Cecembia lonarensis]EKB48670.1 molybdopterin biosynthesis protein MoeB [Cecembia lonarensis LW9]
MKTYISYLQITAIIFCLLFSLAFINNAFAQEGAPKLSPDQFEKKANKNKRHVMLDIRTPEEVAEGYIEGAEFIDFLGGYFEEILEELPKNRVYYVYCRSARRTIPATEKMKALGFKKVYMLEGGLNNWMEAGKPVVSSPK